MNWEATVSSNRTYGNASVNVIKVTPAAVWRRGGKCKFPHSPAKVFTFGYGIQNEVEIFTLTVYRTSHSVSLLVGTRGAPFYAPSV